jgi:hypothetical protein
MATTYGERLQQALTHAHKTVPELARQLVKPDGQRGISGSAVYQVLRGETRAHTAENCLRAARYLQVDAFWLATGQGHMLEQPAATLAAHEPPPPHYYSNSDALSALRQLLQALPPDLRSTAADILSGWARSGGEDDRAPVLLSLTALPTKRQA